MWDTILGVLGKGWEGQMAGNLLGEHPLHEDAVTNTNNIYLSNLYAQVYDGLLTFN